jgi:hypothetical protein
MRLLVIMAMTVGLCDHWVRERFTERLSKGDTAEVVAMGAEDFIVADVVDVCWKRMFLYLANFLWQSLRLVSEEPFCFCILRVLGFLEVEASDDHQ